MRGEISKFDKSIVQSVQPETKKKQDPCYYENMDKSLYYELHQRHLFEEEIIVLHKPSFPFEVLLFYKFHLWGN